MFDIYLLDLNSGDTVNLTKRDKSHEGLPTWSPDGAKIAFVSTRDGNQDIYVMNSDGTDQINISNNDYNDGSPDWSPVLD